jgi:hypothetical protein
MEGSSVFRFFGVTTTVGCALVACNFLVDAEFNGKTFAGQDGSSMEPVKCGGYQLTPGQCGDCITTKCKDQIDTLCADTKATATIGDISDCTSDPNIKDGKCLRVYTDAAAVTFNDTSGHVINARVCVTQQCGNPNGCNVCDGLTYTRAAGDTEQPLTNSVSTCADCLLKNCNNVLLGLDQPKAGHCCYSSTVETVWGHCVRDPKGGQRDCDGVNMAAAPDAGDPTDCDVRLALCAKTQCNASCAPF